MKLSPSSILEFQKTWEIETGENISYEKAEEEAKNMLALFILLYKK